MNEKILELADKAYNDNYKIIGHADIPDQFCYAFAELIVEECVQTLINNMPERYTNEAAEEDWDKGYDRAMKDCVHYILDHFGVEE